VSSFKFKDKYFFLRDVYEKIKGAIKVKGKRRERQLSYKEYRDILSKYFDIVIKEVAENRDRVKLPAKFGSIYIKKCEHKRAFHIRVDSEETFKTGKVVRYKVPILDDYYNKLIWIRPFRFCKCKMIPLSRFKRIINKVKEY
jgi:nucleoid DNA-binding protein